MMWKYYVDELMHPSFERKTRPRIGQVVTFKGAKYEVWYIEEGSDCTNVRVERLAVQPNP